MELFDVVTLVDDLPADSLLAGSRGTVVHIFSEPDTAYEVEFTDDDGSTIAMVTLKADQFVVERS
jgi:hypothetical protein